MCIATFNSPFGTFNFQICDYNGEWNQIGGIYMFCKYNAAINVPIPLYIGQTNNFKTRLSNHEKWAGSVRHGAQNVLALVESSESRRNFLESSFIRLLDPPLNTQLPKLVHEHLIVGLGVLKQPPNQQNAPRLCGLQNPYQHFARPRLGLGGQFPK